MPNNNYTININNNAPETGSSNQSSQSSQSGGVQNISSAIDGLVHTIVNELSDSQGSAQLDSPPQNAYEVVISDATGPGEQLQELMSNMFSSTGSFTGPSISPSTHRFTGSFTGPSSGSFTGPYISSLTESLAESLNQPGV